MDYAWRLALALIGLLFLRTALYHTRWGHGGFVRNIVAGAAGALLILPIFRFNITAGLIVLAVGVIVVLPYKQSAIFWLKTSTKRGLRKIAGEWGTALQEDSESGLFQAVKEKAADSDIAIWVGNVLTHVRSLHPGVQTRQTQYMLAFVVKLNTHPPFQCSLMKGWRSPKYFEKEWRHTTTMQGEIFSLNMGDMLSEGPDDMATGGKADDLAEYTHLTHDRFGAFYATMGTQPDLFDQLFQGELLEEFFGSAFQTLQYEMNVTPTSVNVYTTYCPYKAQKRNTEFLQRLARRLSELSEDGKAGGTQLDSPAS